MKVIANPMLFAESGELDRLRGSARCKGPLWICPDPQPLNSAQTHRACALFRSIGRLVPKIGSPARSAGLELRIAMDLLEGGNDAAEPDNDFWQAKYRALFLRPSVEPILCSYWLRLTRLAFKRVDALQMAAALGGRPLVYRNASCVGVSASGNVKFEPVDIAVEWLPKLRQAGENEVLRMALPAYCYAQILMSHPFSDANGRVARAMVHGAIARLTGMEFPCLALAPAFYRSAEELGAALTRLSATGDWSEYHDHFLSALEQSFRITSAFLRTQSN